MKIYVDAFKKPISKEDVQLVIQVLMQKGMVQPMTVQHSTALGMTKVNVIFRLLDDAGVISIPGLNGRRSLYLRDQKQATNAALRQLRKGNA